MTQLQQLEFELLQQFAAACEVLHLEWFLVCGSALGAVKYHGFIPWDDDVDVALLREDYEIFVASAPALLPKWCFLQNYRTDPAFPGIYSKLRNSGTTFVETSVAHLPIHHGVYIDVFPLDGYPKGKWSQRRLEWKKKILMCQLNTAFDYPYRGLPGALISFFRLLRYQDRTERTAARLERLLSKYSAVESAVLCNHGNWQGRLEYAPRTQYGAGAEVEFEGMRVRVPENYDAYLTQKYGAWRETLPPEAQKGHHTCVYLDTERPFGAYLSGGTAHER